MAGERSAATQSGEFAGTRVGQIRSPAHANKRNYKPAVLRYRISPEEYHVRRGIPSSLKPHPCTIL